MLTQLTIHNFGLIDSLTVDFCGSLTVFTGETGAGKSILIDAMRYALGERMNSSQVRDTAKPCIVETVFELTDKALRESPVLSEYLGDDDVLIIKRAYQPDGRSKNKINGFTVTSAQLKEAGNLLLDLHGPHDHQMLFSEEAHISILDRLADLNKEKADYLEKYNIYADLKKELDEITLLSSSSERELDMLTHQIKELEQVPLDEAKYEELLRESTRINNSEKLYECVKQLLFILDNEETGINNSIPEAFGHMRALNDTDPATSELADILDRIQDDSSTLISELTDYMEGLSFQPEEANEINRKYDTYYDIMRKYGPTLEDTKSFYISARKKYDLLSDIEHNTADISKRITSATKELDQLAQKITSKRKKTAKGLKDTIEKELKELGIVHVQFECRIETSEMTRSGKDRVVFYISPNAGEELKPLADIVSSGEAARIMLALKKALTKVDPIPTLVFDEIDAQIGGRLGTITGKKLKELSGDRQVILITHLPQIASFGDRHLKVSKSVTSGRTSVNVTLLEGAAREDELAKMMSGEKESPIAVKHAKDMLAHAQK